MKLSIISSLIIVSLATSTFASNSNFSETRPRSSSKGKEEAGQEQAPQRATIAVAASTRPSSARQAFSDQDLYDLEQIIEEARCQAELAKDPEHKKEYSAHLLESYHKIAQNPFVLSVQHQDYKPSKQDPLHALQVDLSLQLADLGHIMEPLIRDHLQQSGMVEEKSSSTTPPVTKWTPEQVASAKKDHKARMATLSQSYETYAALPKPAVVLLSHWTGKPVVTSLCLELISLKVLQEQVRYGHLLRTFAPNESCSLSTIAFGSHDNLMKSKAVISTVVEKMKQYQLDNPHISPCISMLPECKRIVLELMRDCPDLIAPRSLDAFQATTSIEVRMRELRAQKQVLCASTSKSPLYDKATHIVNFKRLADQGKELVETITTRVLSDDFLAIYLEDLKNVRAGMFDNPWFKQVWEMSEKINIYAPNLPREDKEAVIIMRNTMQTIDEVIKQTCAKLGL
jgi:hypothetical protein